MAAGTFGSLGPSSPFLAGGITHAGAGIVALRYHQRFGATFARPARGALILVCPGWEWSEGPG